jgi:flavin reductase (DIM6/NTAB) family NADH-FMN oxidoreductase RutF
MTSSAMGAEASGNAFAASTLRRCLGRFATGVAVATYETPEGPRGLTVNSFTSVSLDPPLVLLCLDKKSRAIEYLPNSPFALNVLGADQRDVAWLFAGKPGAASADWRYVHDIPLLQNSLAWLTCAPFANHEAGDHIIIVGRVSDFGACEREPLCFYRGEFIELAPSSRELPDRRETAA